ATTPPVKLQAVLAFKEVLVRDPQRHDIRRRLVARELELGAAEDALAHLQPLLTAFPEDGELEYQIGACKEARGEYAAGEKAYEKALQHAKPPKPIEYYLRLADLRRQRLRQPAEADKVIEQLVKENPESFRAYLARAAYLQRSGAPLNLA